MLRALVLLLALAAPAQANPWLREAGSTYLLVQHEGSRDGWTSIYAEHGLREGLTIGVEVGGHLGRAADAIRLGYEATRPDGRARLFARIPLLGAGRTGPLAPWRASLDLGVGTDFEESEAVIVSGPPMAHGAFGPPLGQEASWPPGGAWTEEVAVYGAPALRGSVGLSLGRGFASPLGGGWVAGDVGLALSEVAETRTTLGLVAGVRPTGWLSLELAVHGEAEGDYEGIKLAPTVGLRRGGTQLRLGAVLERDVPAEARIGVALEF
jgi:hypothetical protein